MCYREWWQNVMLMLQGMVAKYDVIVTGIGGKM